MRRIALALVLGLVTLMLPATAANASCATAWGSRGEASAAHPDSIMTGARAGEHACFDRFVVVLDGEAPGYRVRYVDTFVPSADGKAVDLRGAATLQITMLGVRAHDDDGKATYQPSRAKNMLDVAGFRTFRQVYWGGTFEATTVVGLGVRARLPFRVLTLAGDPTRLVVDVAHRW